jgi:hypothetical protein
MSGTRPKIQYPLALEPVERGETPVNGYQGAEPFAAKASTRKPGFDGTINGGGVRPREISQERGNAFEGTRAVPVWMG